MLWLATLLAISLSSQLISVLAQNGVCIVEPSSPRESCGSDQIPYGDCAVGGCCYDAYNSPRCYRRTDIPESYVCSPDDDRNECGYYGITKDECENDKKCCWDDKPGKPWCFYRNKDPLCSNVDPKEDCGYWGIDERGCEARGCCWEESDRYGAPWCFGKTQTPECAVGDEKREDCGMIGTTEEQCREDECCWKPAEGKPWCYKSIEIPKGEIPVLEIPEERIPEIPEKGIPILEIPEEKIPVEIPEKEIPVEVPVEIPEEVPEPVEIPVEIPEEVPEEVPEEIPVEIPEEVPEEIPEETTPTMHMVKIFLQRMAALSKAKRNLNRQSR